MAIKYWVEGDKITLSLWSSFRSPIALNFLRAVVISYRIEQTCGQPIGHATCGINLFSPRLENL